MFDFFLQPIVEGLLNSRRRVSDRPSWILTSKTPARKWKNVVGYWLFFPQQQGTKSCKEEIFSGNALFFVVPQLKVEPDFRYTNIFKLRRNPILGTQIFLS